MENYYNLFGVDKNVSKEVLDAIYKNLIKTATETEKSKLNYAYSILSDPTKRAEYDAKLKSEHTAQSRQHVQYQPHEPQNVPQKKNGGCLKFVIVGLVIVAIILMFKNCSNKNTDTNTNSSSTDASVSEEGKKPLITKNYGIVDGTDFSDGIAFIECKNGDIYAIDTKGKKLFEVEEAKDLSGLGGYQNGVMVYKNSLYDKSFNVIATPDESGYDRVEYQSESNIIVSKYVESYVGDERLYGVINSNGEWEIELCNLGNWCDDYYTYSWSDGYIDAEEIPNNPYKFDDCYMGQDDKGVKLVDYNNNILIDLSQYNQPNHFSYYNGYLLFDAYNENNVKYAFLLNKDGSFAIDPIRLYETAKISKLDSHGFYVENDVWMSVGEENAGPCYFVEYDGNIIEYDEDMMYVNGFPNGLRLVYEDKFLGTEVYYMNYKGEKVIE